MTYEDIRRVVEGQTQRFLGSITHDEMVDTRTCSLAASAVLALNEIDRQLSEICRAESLKAKPKEPTVVMALDTTDSFAYIPPKMPDAMDITRAMCK